MEMMRNKVSSEIKNCNCKIYSRHNYEKKNVATARHKVAIMRKVAIVRYKVTIVKNCHMWLQRTQIHRRFREKVFNLI